MSKHFRISGLVAGKLRELGILDAVLQHAGLPAGYLDQPKILVTTEEFFALWRALEKASGDPAIGLSLGNEDRVERYDPIAIAALYTRSFGDALQRMSRYKQLTCPEEIAIVRGREECKVQFRFLLAQEQEPEVLIDLCFAWVLSIGRRATNNELRALRVEFTRPPQHQRLYERHFGCPVRFDCANNSLVFANSELDRPFLTHNQELLSMIAPQLEEELKAQHAQQTLVEQVRGVIKRKLAGQRPSLEEVAKELRMSGRTLQRRLQESASSFQRALEEARHEMARHYLAHSPLELNETAYLLGYEDPNSFVRAFHEWEGVPPAAWRRGQGNLTPVSSLPFHSDSATSLPEVS